ncbi:MAG: peptidase C39 [Lachnospiraceae bacterium]
MKIPLHYQMSEYDCGPTAMLNGISFLFEREDIFPELIRNIMLYSLDCYGAEGTPGKSGTSRAAMMFLSNWLNGFGEIRRLPLASRYLSGRSVCLGSESLVNDALHRKGAAVVRLFYDEPHYVLLTGERDGLVYMFDPYYRDCAFAQKDIQVILDRPAEYNRIVPERYFNREDQSIYALGPFKGREAVLLFNEDIKITEENSIEYFI